jgi:hypothetical protein
MLRVGVLGTSRWRPIAGDAHLYDNTLWIGWAKEREWKRGGHMEVSGGQEEVRGGQGRSGEAKGA